MASTAAPQVITAANNPAFGAPRHRDMRLRSRRGSLVGFDDIPLAPSLPRPLTTVHTRSLEMASLGVELAILAGPESARRGIASSVPGFVGAGDAEAGTSGVWWVALPARLCRQ